MIDCTLLLFKERYYILPTLAISQAIILPRDIVLNKDSEVAGTYDWQQQNIPIVTLDLQSLSDALIPHPKIALLHSMQQNNTANFAVLFTGQARRLKVAQEKITWTDEQKRYAVLTDKKAHIDVELVDIAELGLRVNQIMAPSTKIAK